MIYAIKVHSNNSISMIKFKDIESMEKEEGFEKVTAVKYLSLGKSISQHPHGKYVNGKWVKETVQAKSNREANNQAIRVQKNQAIRDQKDSDFIEMYNRLKAAGSI